MRYAQGMSNDETSPTVPRLGLDITVVGPDEKLEETTVAPVEDPKP